MKKATILFICIFTAVMVKAQKVTELNSDLYKIDLEKSPLSEIRVLKRNSVNEIIIRPTQFKRGNYSLTIKKGAVFTFFINREQVITEGEINITTKNLKRIAIIKNSRLHSAKGYTNEKLTFLEKINHKDSLSIKTEYDKNGKIKKEETEFFTVKNFGKKITTTYNNNRSYIIENQINKTSKKFNAKGELIAIKRNNTQAKKVVKFKKERVKAVEPPPSRFYFPFAYKGKWGIVNKDNEEIVLPTYDRIHFANNFSFIVLNKKDDISLIINCFTGEKISGKATFKSSVLLDDKEYLFFTDGKKSELIYLPDGDIKKLNKPYIYLENPANHYKSGKEHKNYLLATLPNKQYVLLNKKEQLKPAFSNSYLKIGLFLDYTHNNKKEYIYTIDDKYRVSIYSSSLEEVMKMKLENKQLLFTAKQKQKIAEKLNFEELYYMSWYDDDGVSILFEEEVPLDIAYGNRFEINTKKKEVYYVNQKGKKQKVYFDDKDDVHFIYFGEEDRKTRIYIPKSYTKNTPLLLPKKYWD